MVPRNKKIKKLNSAVQVIDAKRNTFFMLGFLVKPTIRSINVTVHSQVSLKASVIKHKEFYIKEYGHPTFHWITRRIIYTL